jgi:hypothetical protein
MDRASESLPKTIETALDEPPLSSVMRVVGEKHIEAFLCIELAKLQSMVNVDNRLNLQAHQIPTIAKELIEEFKFESLADFTICFRKGSMGKYDEKLLRLDSAVIFSWMGKYLDEKYNALEGKLMAEKDGFSLNDLSSEQLEKLKQELAPKGMDKQYDPSEESKYQCEKLKTLDGRKAFTIPIEDENGKEIGVIENVYAKDQEMAKEIVRKLISTGELKLKK